MDNPWIRLDDAVKYLNEPSGRDKLLRTLIYVCRLAEWAVKRQHGRKDIAVRIKKLDGSFNDTRRVMRLGKILQVYQTLRLIPEKFRGNPTMLFLETGKALASATYMLNDHGKWIASHQLLAIDGEKYGYRATCAWFTIILFSFCTDFIKLYGSFIAERDLLSKLKTLNRNDDSPEKSEIAIRKSLSDLRIARRFIYIEIAKNLFDTPIAIVGVMKWKDVISVGILSVFGIISSSLAVYSTWRKIVPWTS